MRCRNRWLAAARRANYPAITPTSGDFSPTPCYSSQSQLRQEIRLSIEGIIQEVRAEIDRLQRVLALLGESNVRVQKSADDTTVRPKRQMSAAGRARIAAATRARWAKIRAGKAAGKVSGSSGVLPRPKVSLIARRRMAAAQKARWARVRAAKK
jgi:hypothetical protein